MVVKTGDTVQVNYTLKLENGELINKTEKPFEFTVGSARVIKGFENSVLGMKKGEEKDTVISFEDAYGEHKPELVQEVPIKPFRNSQKKEPELNMILTLKSQDGQKVVARVVKIDKKSDKMKLDLNHILAGKNLNFNLKVVDINK